jgi:hypothetical protein
MAHEKVTFYNKPSNFRSEWDKNNLNKNICTKF